MAASVARIRQTMAFRLRLAPLAHDGGSRKLKLVFSSSPFGRSGAWIPTVAARAAPSTSPATKPPPLLMISSGDRVTPGPPLREIFSPSPTSMTQKWLSASLGTKVAARLSPPLCAQRAHQGIRSSPLAFAWRLRTGVRNAPLPGVKGAANSYAGVAPRFANRIYHGEPEEIFRRDALYISAAHSGRLRT